MHHQSSSKQQLNRRGFFKLAIFVGSGLGISTFTSNRFHWLADAQNTLPPQNQPLLAQGLTSIQLSDFDFEMITVNTKGEIIERSPRKNQYFSEDLGNGVTLDMIAVTGGNFVMGGTPEEVNSIDSERPIHQVNVSSFLMGKYPITQSQWRVIANQPKINLELNPEPSYFQGDNLPVEKVSWYDANEFCQRLSRLTGKQYRLPSEAQWEYACRGGTTTPFSFGSTLTSDLANYFAKESSYADAPLGEYRQQTTPVGMFAPNPLGLYDLHGNVFEWCADHKHQNYQDAPNDDRIWQGKKPAQTGYRALRGGGWGSEAKDCRSANRTFFAPQHKYSVIGFRVALLL